MIWKKMRVLVAAQHALMLAYRAEIYLWVLAHVLPFIMMSVWMTAAGKAAAGGGTGSFSMDEVGYARYFVAAFVVRQFTAVWMIYEFEWHIVEGRLSYLLLRPMNALWHYVSGHFGEQIARFPFFLVMLAVFFAVYPKALGMPQPAAILMGIIAIYAAFALRFALQYCISMLTFWFERASALEQLTFLPYLFLSGLIVPLADMPPPLAAFLRLTPFPYMIDFPVRILTGRLRPGMEMAAGFGIMLAWFAAFAMIGGALWKRGLLRYSGQGA
jgi:ABC-2 type transport system permease protein